MSTRPVKYQRGPKCGTCYGFLTPFTNAERTVVTYMCADGHRGFSEDVKPAGRTFPRPAR
jgi:hypothetical protein